MCVSRVSCESVPSLELRFHLSSIMLKRFSMSFLSLIKTVDRSINRQDTIWLTAQTIRAKYQLKLASDLYVTHYLQNVRINDWLPLHSFRLESSVKFHNPNKITVNMIVNSIGRKCIPFLVLALLQFVRDWGDDWKRFREHSKKCRINYHWVSQVWSKMRFLVQ